MSTFDEKGLEHLFRSHYSGLCRFAVGFVKDDETAREIVQEAFVNLWEKRHSIDPAGPVKTYLSTSVRNRCLNHLRDTKKFSPGLIALEESSVTGTSHQPDRMGEQELHDRIETAIRGLPDKCREIFRLSREQNLKYQEIADRLSISVKTVETQMSKALQHLRRHLADYLPGLLLAFLCQIFASAAPHFLATSHFFSLYQGISPFMCNISGAL